MDDEEALLARLYESYATTHAGQSDEYLEELYFDRDILPHLPKDVSVDIVDIGCGQGLLLSHLHRAGYGRARGIDISQEQVDIAKARGISNVSLGDFRSGGLGSDLAVVVATDFFEHLSKVEVMSAFDAIYTALAPGGSLIARVPNATSPFGGNFQFGDFTHRTQFTPRSLSQVANAASFRASEYFPCGPVGHGAHLLAKKLTWGAFERLMKMSMAAETGPRHGHIVTQNFVIVVRK